MSLQESDEDKLTASCAASGPSCVNSVHWPQASAAHDKIITKESLIGI